MCHINNYIAFSAISLFLFFSNNLVSFAAPPPIPASIGGTITIDGNLLTQATDDGYQVVVKNSNGEVYVPAAEDTDGLNASGFYVINIPLFEATVQPNGANPGETAYIHIYQDDLELNIISPVNGSIQIGESGSITTINIEVGFSSSTTTSATTGFGSISGRVTDTAGNPLAGIFINALDPEVTDNGGYMSHGYAYTDASGSYIIEGVEPGSYAIYFELYNPWKLPRNKYIFLEVYNDKQSISSADLVTVLDGITTTNIDAQVDPGNDCPASMVIGRKQAGLLTLYRNFRDARLAKTEAGKALTALYYRHAPEVSELLASQDDVRTDGRRLLLNLAPNMFLSMFRHQELRITAAQQIRITTFLKQLRKTGSKDLQAAIDDVLRRISDGTLQNELGYSIR